MSFSGGMIAATLKLHRNLHSSVCLVSVYCNLQVQQQQQHSIRHTNKGQSRTPAQQHSTNGSQSSRKSGSPASQTSRGTDVVLYYCTGWSQAKLHCSVNAGAWQDVDFEQVHCQTACAAYGSTCHMQSKNYGQVQAHKNFAVCMQVNSSNGKWCVARVLLNNVGGQPEPDQPLVEFVVHNGAGVYDKPQTGTWQTVLTH